MSNTQLFAFVEGKSDRYFFGKICEVACAAHGIKYQIVIAKEIPEGTPGKQGLLNFFGILKGQNKLSIEFKGQHSEVIFFLDKDIDDLERIRKRSDHVVYTRYYERENSVFVEGDIAEGAAAACSMDVPTLRAYIGDQRQWLQTMTERWKEWVTLCLFSKLHRIGCECTYRSISRINNPWHHTADMLLYDEKKAVVEQRSTMTSDAFEDAYLRRQKRVNAKYNKGEQDHIFKGSWYPAILGSFLKEYPGSITDSAGLETRLTACISQTLDFSQPWATHYVTPVRQLVSRLLVSQES